MDTIHLHLTHWHRHLVYVMSQLKYVYVCDFLWRRIYIFDIILWNLYFIFCRITISSVWSCQLRIQYSMWPIFVFDDTLKIPISIYSWNSYLNDIDTSSMNIFRHESLYFIFELRIVPVFINTFYYSNYSIIIVIVCIFKGLRVSKLMIMSYHFILYAKQKMLINI